MYIFVESGEEENRALMLFFVPCPWNSTGPALVLTEFLGPFYSNISESVYELSLGSDQRNTQGNSSLIPFWF